MDKHQTGQAPSKPRLMLTQDAAQRLKRDGQVAGAVMNHAFSIEQRYSKELEKLTALMVKEMKAAIVAELQQAVTKVEATLGKTGQDADEPTDKPTAATGTGVMTAIEKVNARFKKMFASLSGGLAKGMVGQVSKTSETNVSASLKELVGRHTVGMGFMNNPQTAAAIKGAITENAALISSFPDEYAARLKKTMKTSLLHGGNLGAFKKSVDRIIDRTDKDAGIIKRKVMNTAIDQTRKAYVAMNETRLKAAGVKKFEWIHSGGGATARPFHLHQWPTGLNGGIFEFANPPVIDPDTGERGMPAQLPNCFPAWSKINFADGCHKMFRHRYDGELTKIVTGSGKILECTPNHPILTASGWKAAKLVDVGDYVFHAGYQSADIIKTDIDNIEVSIGDAFNALAVLFGSDVIHGAGSGFEFHGDMAGDNIDIVSANGFLPDSIDPAGAQGIIEFALSLANEVVDQYGLIGDRLCYRTAFRLFRVPERFIGRLCALLTFLESETAGADNARFRLASYIHAACNKSAPYSMTGNLEMLGNGLFADAGGIHGKDFIIRQVLCAGMRAFNFRNDKAIGADELGEIVRATLENGGNLLQSVPIIKQLDCVVEKVVGEKFSGHVYNLENEKNWYSAEGIITHNCKCTFRPVVEFDESGELSEEEMAGILGEAPRQAPKETPISPPLTPLPRDFYGAGTNRLSPASPAFNPRDYFGRPEPAPRVDTTTPPLRPVGFSRTPPKKPPTIKGGSAPTNVPRVPPKPRKPKVAKPTKIPKPRKPPAIPKPKVQLPPRTVQPVKPRVTKPPVKPLDDKARLEALAAANAEAKRKLAEQQAKNAAQAKQLEEERRKLAELEAKKVKGSDL